MTRRAWLVALGTVSACAAIGAFLYLRLRQVSGLPPVRVTYVLAGLLLCTAAFVFRGARLEFLLPPSGRLGLARASAVSASSAFLLHVVPFRGGEVASIALYRRELGLSWLRSGALSALVKVVDAAAVLLMGVGGGLVLLARSGPPTLRAASALLGGTCALGLLGLPWIAGRFLSRFATRAPEGSRRRRMAEELAAGLAAAHDAPRMYAVAFASALLFLAVQLCGISIALAGARLPASLSALAFASAASVLSAVAVPSPTGTFGTAESGFAAGLVAAGVPLAIAVASGIVAHLLATAASGLAAIPILSRTGTLEHTKSDS